MSKKPSFFNHSFVYILLVLGVLQTACNDNRKVLETDGMEMIYIPAGEFQMGANEGDNNEKPAHTVNLDAFWIDKTEVTNEMFAWEWVADWYDRTYYSGSPQRNPTGPSSGEYKVLRGGSWVEEAGRVRSTVRLRNYPDERCDNFGFRCARSAASP